MLFTGETRLYRLANEPEIIRALKHDEGPHDNDNNDYENAELDVRFEEDVNLKFYLKV